MSFEDYSWDPDQSSQRGENVFTRTCSGYIASVDEINGTVTVSLEDFSGTRPNVELSFDYISSVGPGWFRFMPSIGDKILVGFRPNNQLEILRYKAVSYKQLAQFAAAANPPFVFRTLRSGEFEIMSSGFAEIWGSRNGKLHLAGGLATIDLDNPTNQITYTAVLHEFSSDGSNFNFGSVRRANPLKTTDDEAVTAPGLPQKELQITLVQSIAGVPLTLYSATIGAVLDYTPALPNGIFTPRLSTDTATPLVTDINVYTLDGIQSVRAQIDNLGNTRIDLPASAVFGLHIVAATGGISTSSLTASIAATSTLSLSGTALATLSSATEATVSAPLVNIAATGGGFVKLGNGTSTLGVLMQTLVVDLQALNVTLSAFMAAMIAIAPIPILSGAEISVPAGVAAIDLVTQTAALTALTAQIAAVLL